MSIPLKKQFLATLLLTGLTFPLFILPFFASAQSQTAIDAQVTGNSNVVTGRESQAAIDARAVGDAAAQAATANNASAVTVNGTPAGTRTPAPGVGGWTPAPSSWSLSSLTIGIVGYLLYVAASLFDVAVDNFVLGMGGWVNGSLALSIDLVWTIVRDIVNLTFIFGLVYVGMKTILDADTGVRRLLAMIIIGALLVNFSLFVSKLVIDVANVTAVQVYNAMGIGESARGTNLASLSTSEVFMARMGIINLVAVPGTGGTMMNRVGGWNTGGEALLPFVIGAAFFILVSTFVFAAAALLLTIRFGVLLILMMLSPIAFAAAVFPTLKSWSDKWWHSLFNQAFFAPALFFMLYLTLKVAEGYATHTRAFDKTFLGTAEGGKQGFTTAAFFCLTIVLMVASLIIAKQMGAYGASRALAVGAKSANFLRRSAQGYALRNTVGRAGQWASNKYESLDEAGNRKYGKVYKGARIAANIASFGALSDRSIRSGLKSAEKAKFGGYYSLADDKAYDKEVSATRSKITREKEFNSAIKAGLANSAALDDMEKALQKATTAELEELGADILEKVEVAFRLTNNQMENVMKSDKFTAAQKDAISSARRTGLVNSFGTAGLSANVGKLSTPQLEILGSDILKAQAANLTSSQIDDIKKSKNFTERQYTEIKNAREAGLRSKFSAAAASRTVPAFFAGLKASDIANLPTPILTDPQAIPHLKPAWLSEMKKTLKDSDRNAIRGEIMTAGRGHPAYQWLTTTPAGQEF